MTVNLYTKINKSLLSKKRDNVIPAYHGEIIIGHVTKLLEEIQEGIFHCEVKVLPEKEELVLSLMQQEMNKLNG